jgi:CHAT domain-containing protein
VHHIRTEKWYLAYLVALAMGGVWHPGAATATEPASDDALHQHVAAGDRFFRTGDFEHALSEWDLALQSTESETHPLARSDVFAREAEAFRALGYLERAVVAFRQAAVLSTADEVRMARILGGLGGALQAAGLPKDAREQLEASIALSRKIGRKDIEAAALNNLGNLLAALDLSEAAIGAYESSAKLASDTPNTLLQSQAAINAARVAERAGKLELAESLGRAADKASALLLPSHDSAYVSIALGQLYLLLHKDSPSQSRLDASLRSLGRALKIAQEIGDRRAESYALGYLGEVYEHEGSVSDALGLTRRATFVAQQLNAPDSLYRWEWQTGRLLRAQRDPAAAIAAYQRAVAQLQSIRSDLGVSLASGRSSFREVLGPLYFELADLLLQQSAATRDPARAQQLLAGARDTIELSKSAELRDYFRDNCVTALQSKVTQVEKIGAHTAVIYPVMLQDRFELLVTFPDGIREYRLNVDAKSLNEAIRNFRAAIENRTTLGYLPIAQQLYAWLVKPIETELASHKTDTLVFIPEGALRTIPLSALHDGTQFLVARFAIATTPGLTLTDPQPLTTRPSQVLLTGLSESVQGYPALPNVAKELSAVQEIGGGQLLEDKDYVLDNLEREFSSNSFTVVHIASHGQFSSDPKQTFLLTYDGKLTMDQLEKLIAPSRYRDEPLELLTLSACETAVGDDRAALGLAGVAIKAGARSALASLWFINDESTAVLISDFYRNLKLPGLSKAKALQQAQVKMIEAGRFTHPGDWAPFLLIGNWL